MTLFWGVSAYSTLRSPPAAAFTHQPPAICSSSAAEKLSLLPLLKMNSNPECLRLSTCLLLSPNVQTRDSESPTLAHEAKARQTSWSGARLNESDKYVRLFVHTRKACSYILIAVIIRIKIWVFFSDPYKQWCFQKSDICSGCFLILTLLNVSMLLCHLQ